jgi:hypothetical protein
MDKNKYVKLSAIARIAKPMDAFHGKEEKSSDEEEYKSESDMVECPKCKHEFKPDAEGNEEEGAEEED